MFTLLSDIYASLNRKEEYSILILGLDDAGKTTLLERIKSQRGLASLPPDRITPTVEMDKKKIGFWDLGGQSSLRSLWTNYFSAAHMILFVIDASTPGRLDESCGVLRDLADTGELDEMPILVLANKSDVQSLSVEEIKDSINAIVAKIDPLEGGVLACSGRTGEGVDAVLDWISSRVTRNKAARPPVLR